MAIPVIRLKLYVWRPRDESTFSFSICPRQKSSCTSPVTNTYRAPISKTIISFNYVWNQIYIALFKVYNLYKLIYHILKYQCCISYNKSISKNVPQILPWTVRVADASAFPTMFSATQVYDPMSLAVTFRIFKVWSSLISYLVT